MDNVPTEFIENVLCQAASLWTTSKYSQLSGLFGHCANQLDENKIDKAVHILDGEAVDVKYVTAKDKWVNVVEIHVPPKFRKRNYIQYSTSLSVVPILNELKKPLEKLSQEPGMMTLQLFSSSIDTKWVQLFSSIRNLNAMYIQEALWNEDIIALLKNLLKQEQLVELETNTVFYGPQEREILEAFLLQGQFKSLIFNSWNAKAYDSLKLLPRDKMTSKTITWRCKIDIDYKSFKISGSSETMISLETEEFSVRYINYEAAADMSLEKFLIGVQCTAVRFK
ncbi:hypothetical protein L596_016109 [Steinernema carpocapsae]|uniref:Uncharacterized protein n=1 Tax=Steinernema carpocapsae TaxID=34508 RepID=A0A4U5NI07_STECR|nr:hypothetical protein L596_016109 [Steinernema carpocapsae]